MEETLLKQFKCCLSETNDNHFLFDPYLLSCGGNACKKCINDPYCLNVTCKQCDENHSNDDLDSAYPNPAVKYFIDKAHFNDIYAKFKSEITEVTTKKGKIKQLFLEI